MKRPTGSRQMNSWLRFGSPLRVAQRAAQSFKRYGVTAANTQMDGWFRKELV